MFILFIILSCIFVGFFKFYFIFKLYIIVLVLPHIKMNPPQVYMCSPSWTLLPPPSPYHPSGLSQCTSPKHPVSCIEPGLATRFIPDILHVSMTFSDVYKAANSYMVWRWWKFLKLDGDGHKILWLYHWVIHFKWLKFMVYKL